MSLPKNWTTAELGNLVELIRGVSYKKDDAQFSGSEGRIPILRATNISSGQLDFDELVYVPSKYVSAEQMLRKDDIVVAASSGSLSVVGKAAPLKRDWVGSFGAFCLGIRPDPAINPSYVSYYLQSSEYRSIISSLAAGVNINNLKRGHLASLVFPIAPRGEQDRIVAEIEKEFTRLDDAVAALKRVQANLTRYRASVLKAACEGRLVPTEAELARKEKRDYEPASELLKRILVERRAKWEGDQLAKMTAAGKPPKDDEWKKKYKEPATPDISGLPGLPEGWAWACLEQLTDLVRNGISAKPDLTEGLAILRISAVRPMEVSVEDIRFLPIKDEYKDYALKVGDLLFTRYNGNRDYVGVCGRVRRLHRVTVHPDKLIRAVPVSRETAAWVEVAVNLGVSREFLSRRIRTTAGQSGVSGEDIKQIPLPLPPRAEQLRLTAEIDRLLTGESAIRQQFADNIARSAQLRNSILSRAFEGKLVSHDPGDEPASVLLGRIKGTLGRSVRQRDDPRASTGASA